MPMSRLPFLFCARETIETKSKNKVQKLNVVIEVGVGELSKEKQPMMAKIQRFITHTPHHAIYHAEICIFVSILYRI